MSSQERKQHGDNQAKSEDSMNTKDFLIGALIGGMVGAAAALFLSPKSGREIRSNLNEQASVLKEKTGQFRETAMNKGIELATVAKEKTNVLTQNVSKQSTEIVNKVKSIKPNSGANRQTADSDFEKNHNTDYDQEIQRRLEETKRAFDETEDKYNQ
ncbi:YtxH domain-containing protein [Bacillus sp. FJAT-29790]|uniref:YtxH domain-containing protein n=1 Tax=Bacillus sp. FJAT-29790 TaxID=1895002 RepID=UPI001C21748F|nr:YtxH domain-containing protein [Bacillus sp. FJAT-29790]MBU8879760.1 YtxH domain-containing protein [Bacillus sp. FJAT-29790]